MEIESGTLLGLVTGYFGSLVVWWGAAFKFKDFYTHKVSSFIFYTLLGCGFLSFTVFSFLINYISHLQENLANNTEALNAISSLSKPYINLIYFTWLVITVYFIAWVLLTVLIQSYENHERQKRNRQ